MGELLKGAAGYMTFGKAAEKAVLEKAEKLKLTGMKEKAISKTRYLYLENEMQIDGKNFSVFPDIQKLPDLSNRFYIHDIKLKEATNAQRNSNLKSSPPFSGNQSIASNIIITDTENNINTELQQLALQAHNLRKKKK